MRLFRIVSGTVDELNRQFDRIAQAVTIIEKAAPPDQSRIYVTPPTPAGVTDVTATPPISSTGGTTPNISHDNSGVTAGSYDYVSVVLDGKGHVTSAVAGAPVVGVFGGTNVTITGTAQNPVVNAIVPALGAKYCSCWGGANISFGSTACGPAFLGMGQWYSPLPDFGYTAALTSSTQEFGIRVLSNGLYGTATGFAIALYVNGSFAANLMTGLLGTDYATTSHQSVSITQGDVVSVALDDDGSGVISGGTATLFVSGAFY